MEPLSVEEAAQALIKTIFRMCREFRTYQLDLNALAQRLIH